MKKILALVTAVLLMLSLPACGGDNTSANTTPNELNLEDTYQTITQNANLPEMYAVDAELMLDLYGIRQEYCKQAVLYICVNSLRADEIWLLEAADAASMETLKSLMQSRLDQKDAESVTYSPEQNAVVKAAQIIEAGNYLVMIVSPDAAAIADAFRAAAGI